MNAGQSAEKPFAPKRGETKIALNYHQTKRLLRFRGWLNVGLKRSKATATLEGQAERHAADLTRCFPFLFAPFFLGFPLHRKCTRVFHFEPIGGAPGTLGGILH
jgi:hypothetical protein